MQKHTLTRKQAMFFINLKTKLNSMQNMISSVFQQNGVVEMPYMWFRLEGYGNQAHKREKLLPSMRPYVKIKACIFHDM